jgi:hypothetical protein
MIWFSNNPGVPRRCAGPVTGTIAADVVAIAGQNVSPGDFDARGRDHLQYASGNIHTAKFPAGEIRGQIRRGDRDDDR